MARSTGKSSRQGAAKTRTQVYNPATGNYIKKDTSTGNFLEVKQDGKPFKGITKEQTNVKANPSVSKATAAKAEKAVINLKNSKKKK